MNLAERAAAQQAQQLCFPEGFLQGYVTEAELAKCIALDISSEKFKDLAQHFPNDGPTVVLGFLEVCEGEIFNSAAVIEAGVVIGCYRKQHLLPSENAFTPGQESPVFEVRNIKFGVKICYDTNFPGAAKQVSEKGASLLVCCANNMLPRKTAEKYKKLHNSVRGERCKETGLWLISSDVTGERDGCVSWGPTAVLNPGGDVVDQLPLGKTGLLFADIPLAI